MESSGMESIYPPDRVKASDYVNLADYFFNYSSAISSDLTASTSNTQSGNKEDEGSKRIIETANIEAIIGIDLAPKTLDILEKDCSIDQLFCEGEVKRRPILKPQKYTLRGAIFDGSLFVPDNPDLEVLRKKAEIEKIRNCEKLLFLNKENFHNIIVEEDEDKKLPINLAPGSDFVMHVYFYKPFSYNFLSKNYSERFRFTQEIQMLGRNTLTELRDKIVCTCDSGIQAEVERPSDDISHLQKAKEKYPSGSFFINGVFYNDMRSPDAIDYSEVVIEWARQRKVGTFTSDDMNSTRLRDLSPRLGYPYLYMHQGDCEHIMVFADARVLTNNDCLNSHQYPRVYAVHRSTCIMCCMCNLFAAKWLIKDSERLPHSSTFLCTKCTESYCYKDGEKIGQFKLYPLFNKYAES